MALVTAQNGSGPVHAILGPTNTGKTHLAIERMLKHQTGIIGLPLRLLAREVFDRLCGLVDPRHVALVTGEERITSPESRYWVCTVEAMPVSRPIDFLAVDEVQLAADRERGYVFTDRLIAARGKQETLFLGSETIAPLLRRLIPGVSIETRARLSPLSYLGPRKLSRLPRRSAVIAYRAEDVYATAEFLRRQKGGAAVVMGALSPRTRNAQVALFEDGEVDYLVATDAIGMGLNLNIDHVALASLRKFDGSITRQLTASEIGQVAGRAGRYLSPGSFGTTGEATTLDEDTVTAIEGHQYRPLRRLRYRNSNVDLSSVPGLMTSLDTPPRHDFLIRAPEADDLRALRQLYQEPDIANAARSPSNVAVLWRVCGIPDFQQMLHETHVSLLARIFRHLLDSDGRLPSDFLAGHIRALDSVHGDIDTLQTRLAHIRTWTYVAHQHDWFDDATYWQQTAQNVEGRLSDALHQRLTQRFVDREHAATLRRLQDAGTLAVTVDDDGTVLLNDAVIGVVEGLRLIRNATIPSSSARFLRRELRTEFEQRAIRIVNAQRHDIVWRNGTLYWSSAPLAKLSAADHLLKPRLHLLVDDDILKRDQIQRVRKRLQSWVDAEVSDRLRPLVDLERLDLDAAGRGLVFRLTQALGVIERENASDLLTQRTQRDVRKLERAGVVFGRRFVYLPALLRPRRAHLANELRSLHMHRPVHHAPDGRVSIDAPDDGNAVCPVGFWAIGSRWYRVDAVERLATRLASGPPPVVVTSQLLSLVGAPRDSFGQVAAFLGYRFDDSDRTRLLPLPKASDRTKRRRRTQSHSKAESPFAVLEALKGRAGS